MTETDGEGRAVPGGGRERGSEGKEQGRGSGTGNLGAAALVQTRRVPGPGRPCQSTQHTEAWGAGTGEGHAASWGGPPTAPSSLLPAGAGPRTPSLLSKHTCPPTHLHIHAHAHTSRHAPSAHRPMHTICLTQGPPVCQDGMPGPGPGPAGTYLRPCPLWLPCPWLRQPRRACGSRNLLDPLQEASLPAGATEPRLFGPILPTLHSLNNKHGGGPAPRRPSATAPLPTLPHRSPPVLA